MARRAKRVEEEDQDLNLAPIMNMVIILIPLLLLSVVFLKVGVINVSLPSLAPATASQTLEEKEEKIVVTIASNGFYVSTSRGTMTPESSCGTEGPTLCLEGEQRGKNLDTTFAQAASMLRAGQHARGQEMMNEALDAYDWMRLYNVLSKLKKENPKVDKIHVSAGPNVPYAAVVRLFDVARTKLDKDHYANAQAFWQAKPLSRDPSRAELFANPILSITK